MAYRALLFCPDEKTARTVTQILGELEFTVEPCLEPFAAVKKLMGEHFDAIVVDCDNEQNATLLFKSARNSTSNQASLAVAVVEGQAGVAKAFRIGANLVLTKPINIEQSKGTLRVARGLLRKGEPVKPGAPAPTTPTPAASAPKPAPARPVAPAKPAASAPRPAVPPVAKPVASPTPSAVASSAPAAQDQHHQAISLEPVSQSQKLPLPPDAKPAFTSPSPAAFAGGAASAPAPAREAHEPHFPETTPASAPNPAKALFEKPAEAVASESHSSSVAPTSFTFGGSNVPAESSGGKKKILIAVAAVVVVAAGLYFAWTYYQGRNTQTGTFESRISGPVATPQATKPVSIPPKPLPTEPAPATPTSSSPSAKPAAQPNAEAAAPATSTAADDNDAPSENDAPAPTTSSKPSTSASTSGKAASSAKPAAAAPLVVKGGSAPAVHSKPAPSADAPAPSMIGIATTAASAPLPNLVNSTGSAPKPVLQTINISQGVSQGLLLKKVQPQYPRNALAMHVEGAVELMATISTTGNITAVKVVSGEQLLTKVAVDAVKQWKYKPYLLNGEPVEIQTQVTVNFKLPH